MKSHATVIALGIALVAVGALLFVARPHAVVHASSVTQNPQQPVVLRPDTFAETAPVRDLKPQSLAPVKGQSKFDPDKVIVLGEDEEEIKVIKNPSLPNRISQDGKFTDGALKSNAATAGGPLASGTPLPPPAVSFEGIDSSVNVPILGGRVLPPDPNGDVGPTQYVQTVNIAFQVFSKTGTPLTPATNLRSLWNPLGSSNACVTNGFGDPIVLYDQLADRWMISQFTSGLSTNHQCIAVSKTGDATGAYYLYDYNVGPLFNDYPHFGMWPDAYYMTTNQFFGNQFYGAGAFAFDRLRMLKGDPNAAVIYFNLNTGCPDACFFGGMLPSDLDGYNLPPAGRPNTFGLLDTTTTVRLYDFHADFNNPASSTFTERSDSPVTVAPYDFSNPPGRNDIEQPRPASPTPTPPNPPSFYLDSIQDRLMFRQTYRNFGGREALVLTHTVNVSGVTATTPATHQSGERYYEISRPLPGGAFAVFNQETFSPDAGNGSGGDNRWMGSTAQDNKGNLAMAFSVSGVNTFPSIRYTGRLAGPTTTLAPEQSLIIGTGVQRSTSGRWGDYSDLTVDPADDCTFWYTNEYYTAAGQATSTAQWQTRIGAFKIPECTAPPLGTLTGRITDCSSGLPIPNAFVDISPGFSRATLADGTYSATLPPGSYTVTISAPGYASSQQTINVSNGGTSTVNACLTPIPVPTASGLTLVSESCPPANGAADPGETVTVRLNVTNNGAAATSNLVGTLQPNANVLAPSGPQTYGALAPGAMAGRDFTFTVAGNCGDLITLTLQLQDGANNLGTVSYQLRLGVATAAPFFSENFDGVVAPALPPGWTTTASGASGTPWVTSTTNPNSAPNDAFAPDPSDISDDQLLSPTFAVPAGGAQLTFRNLYNMENGFDGEVLEISVNGGAFQDILLAGGTFVTGGYNSSITATNFGSPIQGRPAWTGLSGGTTAAPAYITTTVNLPSAANGQNVQLKWRVGTDNAVSASGQAGTRIDNVVVSSTTFACNTACGGAPRITTTATLSCSNGNTVAAITITNSGTGAATNVVLTTAKLGNANGTPLPQTVGTLAPGQSVTKTVTFSGAPSGATGLTVGGTYTGGTFSGNRRVTAPACGLALLTPPNSFLPPPALLAAVATRKS